MIRAAGATCSRCTSTRTSRILSIAPRGSEGRFPSLGWALDLGPVAERSPRWVIEGYATFIEGRVTGSGRPHSAWRAAILRDWALNGQLPTYAQLNGDQRFLGGSMAYLVGSAYLEWLVARPGQSDSSLAHVWRRMSARIDRDFNEAFAGVFGAPPAELYGQFTADVTVRAVAARAIIAPDSAPVTVQRLTWFTGAPAIAPNDSFVALTRDSPTEPTTVVIWPLRPSADTGAAHCAAKEHERDSLDVAGIPWRPAPFKAAYTRYPQGGASFFVPRWMPDGKRLLVTRATGPGNGVSRSDLFVWEPATDRVKRITHAGGILHADAMPDGHGAVADRCVDGICSVVRVDLATGAITTIAAGAPRETYVRPRISPDGRTIAAARHANGAWRVVLMDVTGGTMREIGPADGANRYDPAWSADGKRLLVVSEAGGVPNVEELDIATGGARQLTRVISAVRAPAPLRGDSAVYFTRLTPHGYDLDRVDRSAVVAGSAAIAPPIDRTLAPAMRDPPVAADTFPVATLSPKPYGLGPRSLRFLPSFLYGAEGSSAGLMLGGLDPVGKLTWVAQAMIGTKGGWDGGSAAAAWRGWPVEVLGEWFTWRNDPAFQWGFAAPDELDAGSTGFLLKGTWARDYITNKQRLSAGGSAASFADSDPGWSQRDLAFADYRGTFAHSFETRTVSATIALSASAGRTIGESWTRYTTGLTLSGGTDFIGIELSGQFGEMSNANARVRAILPRRLGAALYRRRALLTADLDAGDPGGCAGRHADGHRFRRPSDIRPEAVFLGGQRRLGTSARGSKSWESRRVIPPTAFGSPGCREFVSPVVSAMRSKALWRDQARVYVALTYRP